MAIAAAADLAVYRAEITQFLQTVTLKSSTLLAASAGAARAAGYPDDPLNVSAWKYYVNLRGDYHPADIPMTVMSLDTQQPISFTKEMLRLHSRTAAVYRPGRSEYDALCVRYPNQIDLIKNIVFPVADVDAAMNAGDFTLLAWGDGYLEPYEQDSLLDALRAHLTYLNNRWNLDFLSYELYYGVAYLAYVWQTSAVALFDARIQNIHTAYAHSFHIWAYLSSIGIGDYRDILSRRATLFLYRNMRYIRANRGKHATLILLVNNLLRELAVGLVGKTVYQSTAGGDDTCMWTPEIVSDKIPTEYVGALRAAPNETIAEITYRLYQAGNERDTSLVHIIDETHTLASTSYNTLPTKILELAPLSLDKKYAGLLNNFLLDHMVAMATADKLQIPVSLVDEYTGLTLQLTTRDALVLFYFCQQKTMRQTPVLLPTRYQPVFTYKPSIDTAALPKAVHHRGRFFPIQGAILAEDFCEDAAWPLTTLITGDAFETAMVSMFSTFVRQHLTARNTNSAVVLTAIQTVFAAITERRMSTIRLADVDTYAEWFSRPGHDYRLLVSVYDGASDGIDRYAALADKLIQQLIPLTSTALLRYANVSTRQALYARLKQLFVQLCSYNVTFLDTQRIAEDWILDPKITTELRDNAAVTHRELEEDTLCGVAMNVVHPVTSTADARLHTVTGMDHVWPTTYTTTPGTHLRHTSVHKFTFDQYELPPPLVAISSTGVLQAVGLSTSITLPSA